MLYTILLTFWSAVVHVFAPFLISRRLKKGLEHSLRYTERYGVSDQTRPKGELIWFHGASVGESLSILPIIQKITKQNCQLRLKQRSSLFYSAFFNVAESKTLTFKLNSFLSW